MHINNRYDSYKRRFLELVYIPINIYTTSQDLQTPDLKPGIANSVAIYLDIFKLRLQVSSISEISRFNLTLIAPGENRAFRTGNNNKASSSRPIQ